MPRTGSRGLRSRWIVVGSLLVGALITGLSFGVSRHYEVAYKAGEPVPVTERGAPMAFMMEIGPAADSVAVADVRHILLHGGVFDESGMLGPVDPAWILFDWAFWTVACGILAAIGMRRSPDRPMAAHRTSGG